MSTREPETTAPGASTATTKARSVACPVCKVKAGAPCVSMQDGGAMRRHHPERVNVYWAASRLVQALKE
jgi:hypothetical protein